MKFLKYIFLILFCAIWAIGLIPSLFTEVSSTGLTKDGYQYGDLYRLSNLSQFKDPRKACTGYIPPAKAPISKKVHLYIIGDSFTESQRVGKRDFSVDEFTYINWSNIVHLHLDSTQANILLIESVERHFREKMSAPISLIIPDTATFIEGYESQKFMTKLDNAFKATAVNDRLDGLLFQNEFFLGLKQWKAAFNRNVFDRVNTSTTLVNDGRDLVYYMDTDTSKTSSFHELENSEVDSIVVNLNKSRDFAHSLGFDQVVLSIIPNKVSIVDPQYGSYNNLIDRVYQHPALKIPFIDVLSDYRKMGRSAYLNGDSHWTCEGQTVWLNKANNLINNLVRQPHL